MKKITILLAVFFVFAIPAVSQACFYPDATNSKAEQPWQAIKCWQYNHDWVNGYSGIKLLTQINSTASRWQMTGFNLHPKALVDWDSAAENSQPGLPLPAGYWVTVYQ